MITKLEIENFYSIQNRQILDLVVPGNAPAETDHLVETWVGSKERVPKIIAIFGANGSGKSNVLRALSFIVWFMEESFFFSESRDLPFKPYNNAEHLYRPTKLKLWFSGPGFPMPQTATDGRRHKYSYELEISNGKKQVVRHEAVFFWPTATGSAGG